MKKIYHLSNCTTCQRIIKELSLEEKGFEFQDIKTQPITSAQLEDMHSHAGSYEALFSRRAMKYRALGLGDKNLSEDDYKKYILEEYTFLKRPVIYVDNRVFVGSTKKVIQAAAEAIG